MEKETFTDNMPPREYFEEKFNNVNSRLDSINSRLDKTYKKVTDHYNPTVRLAGEIDKLKSVAISDAVWRWGITIVGLLIIGLSGHLLTTILKMLAD